MSQAGRPPLAAFLAVTALSLASAARPAAGFAPEVATVLASRVTQGLPAAVWNLSWQPAVTAALEGRWAAEELDPEAAVPLHRFDATRSREGLEPVSADSLTGLAPFALAEAVQDLQDAFAGRDPARAAEALARMVWSASDLADPFLTTPPDPGETPGARAWFGDDLESAALEGLAMRYRECGEPLAEALALARASASRRPEVEDAVRRFDAAAVDTLRRERLESALALASALALRAWRVAGGPAWAVSTRGPEVLRVEPNPARDVATLGFSLPRPGEARLELFDAAGRRVATRSLGPLAAGAHRLPLERGLLASLPSGLYVARVSTETSRAIGLVARVGN